MLSQLISTLTLNVEFHGEFASTVLDSVTGCAVHTLLGAGVAYGTIDLNIKLIRPVPKDENLIAEGNVNQNL